MNQPTLPAQPAMGLIKNLADWQGKTIRAVIEHPSGVRGHAVSAVVVFEDDTWSGLVADGGSCDDEAYLALLGGARPITDYLSAKDLMAARMVNQAQHEHLLAQEESRRQADLRNRAESLRAEGERLLQQAQQMEARLASEAAPAP